MNEDKATRYHKLARRAAAAGLAWSIGLLVLLLGTGGSIALREAAMRLVARPGAAGWFVSNAVVAVYLLLLALLHEVGALPISFYRGYILEHRYGLSNETFRGWLYDQAKGALVGGILSLAGVLLLYAAMRRWPFAWWAIAGAGFAALVVVMAGLAPVLLLPIFYRFKPLAREELRDRLLALSARAGVKVLDACEWQLSDRTKKANAALTGLGATRRILVSDTLLASHGDDEIEVILAHELGHHVHRDIWKGIAYESAVACAGLFLTSLVLGWLAPRLGLLGIADVAGLPAVLLTAGVLSLGLLPAANAFSRALERRADRFALELTGNSTGFAIAMRRLAAQNLAEEKPSRWVKWLLYTHPPIDERVEAAERWGRERAGASDAGPSALPDS